jgi:tetratricopeptide (TPR) repeat protein
MKQRLTILSVTALAAFLFGALSKGQGTRFDHQVRNDFFAGFAGNNEAMARAMTTAEATLAAEPNHAEALVWHGSGLYYQAGQAFQKGDPQKGMDLATKGIAEMDKAVALAPDNVGVRIPRGAVLLTATRFQQGPHVGPLVERAMKDYEHTYRLQEKFLDKLGTHPRGELLLGIADAASRMGDKEKATQFYQRAVNDLPDTVYARNAKEWLETGKLAPQKAGCLGCHSGK